MLMNTPFLLAARRDLPANNLGELRSLARERGGRMTFATSSATNLPRFCGEMLKTALGIEMTNVPYSTVPGALQDTIMGYTTIDSGTGFLWVKPDDASATPVFNLDAPSYKENWDLVKRWQDAGYLPADITKFDQEVANMKDGKAVVKTEPAAGQGAGGSPDLGGEVWQRGDVVAELRRLRGEPVAGQLHAVA